MVENDYIFFIHLPGCNKMNKICTSYWGKFLTFSVSFCVVILTAGWLDNNFAKRTQIDVDDFRHPSAKRSC